MFVWKWIFCPYRKSQWQSPTCTGRNEKLSTQDDSSQQWDMWPSPRKSRCSNTTYLNYGLWNLFHLLLQCKCPMLDLPLHMKVIKDPPKAKPDSTTLKWCSLCCTRCQRRIHRTSTSGRHLCNCNNSLTDWHWIPTHWSWDSLNWIKTHQICQKFHKEWHTIDVLNQQVEPLASC